MSGVLPDAVPGVRPDEARLAAEIDRLKVQFPKTRELYREVCALLFFRHGITPTANRLYQLVRRGSMGTPTPVLGGFWACPCCPAGPIGRTPPWTPAPRSCPSPPSPLQNKNQL